MEQNALSLLLVEDNPAEARLLREILKEADGGHSFQVACAQRLDEALRSLARGGYDALLLNLSLPDSSGIQTLERLQSRFPLLPIVVLTGNDNEATALEAVKKGAQNYLVKGQAEGKTLLREIYYAIERKKTEDALSKTTRLLGTILDTTHMLMAYLDIDFNYIRVNLAYAIAHRRDVDYFPGKNHFDIFPRNETEKTFLRVLSTVSPHYEYGKAFEEIFGVPASLTFWDWSIVPTTDETGAVSGLVVTLANVSRQKHAEDELKRSSEKLELEVMARTAELLSANELLRKTNELLRAEIKERIRAEDALSKRQEVLEAIYAIETSFSDSLESTYDRIVITLSRIMSVPFAAAGQVDKNKFKVISEYSQGVFNHDKSIPIVSHPCGIVFKEKKIVRFTGSLKTMFPEQSGTLNAEYISYVGVPIVNKEGTVLGMLCVMDVEKRGFGDQDVHLIEIFARYIEYEIERAVMEEQLRASHEMNLLGRLASGVAHEVRNPLNGILAISEALFQNIGDNPEYVPYLEHIRSQVNRLSALMNDLLDLGKPLLAVEFWPQPLTGILDSVLDSFRQSSRHRHRRIELTGPGLGEVCYVKADFVKMQQVFLNLLENACDHSPENEKVVLEIAGPEEAFVVARVIDNGRGITPDLIDKAFDPFFTTRKGGTGLGLSIVKHSVEMHGGTVTLYNNTPRPGLTVEIRLPLAPVPDAAEARQCAAPSSGMPVNPPLG